MKLGCSVLTISPPKKGDIPLSTAKAISFGSFGSFVSQIYFVGNPPENNAKNAGDHWIFPKAGQAFTLLK